MKSLLFSGFLILTLASTGKHVKVDSANIEESWSGFNNCPGSTLLFKDNSHAICVKETVGRSLEWRIFK